MEQANLLRGVGVKNLCSKTSCAILVMLYCLFVANLHSYQNSVSERNFKTTSVISFTTEDLNLASEKNKKTNKFPFLTSGFQKGKKRYPVFFPPPPIKPISTICAATQDDLCSCSKIPGSIGAVGKKQFVVCANSRIRSFSKKDLQPDQKVDGDLFVFIKKFVSSMLIGSDEIRSISHPKIKYDRETKKWFLIFKTEVKSSVGDVKENGILIIVMHNAVIDKNTRWEMFLIPSDSGEIFDKPTFGLDEHSIFIGTEDHLINKKKEGVSAFVIDKRLLISENVVFGKRFTISKKNRFCTMGIECVDNFDNDPLYGYFIGTTSGTNDRLSVFRYSHQNSDFECFSLPIPIYAKPLNVGHKGNAFLKAGLLDGLDSRIMSAHIRKNRLWTVHGVGVNNIGQSSPTIKTNRIGCRWYEIDLTNDLQLIQFGVLLKPTPENGFSKASYWAGSIMTNGQGHMLICCRKSGIHRYIDAAYGSRITDYSYGKIVRPARLTESKFSYNPKIDIGSNRRSFGDYSCTAIDPSDDMTFWTFQQYCCDRNKWGLSVSKIIVPPPIRPKRIYPSKVSAGKNDIKLIISAFKDHRIDVVEKSNKIYEKKDGYFDPGRNFDKRLRVKINGGVDVKKVTYKNPLEIELIVSTIDADKGKKCIFIMNPDGQKIVSKNLFEVV
jgi:hypothetical protein